MKHTRSCIFVVTIILLLFIFTACDIFVPGYNDDVFINDEDEPEDEAEDEAGGRAGGRDCAAGHRRTV